MDKREAIRTIREAIQSTPPHSDHIIESALEALTASETESLQEEVAALRERLDKLEAKR